MSISANTLLVFWGLLNVVVRLGYVKVDFLKCCKFLLSFGLVCIVVRLRDLILSGVVWSD